MNRGLSIRRIQAFTLTEVMVASAVSLIIFAAVLTAFITFQRSLAGTIDYSRGTTDQQRALDYLSRDIRRALKVSAPKGTNILWLTVPDAYTAYDAQGNPTAPSQTPNASTGTPVYGNGSREIMVCYYVRNNQLLRQQTIRDVTKAPAVVLATSTLVIADAVELLQGTYQNLTSIVTYSVTFAPNMAHGDKGSQQARLSTTLSGSTSLRNPVQKFPTPPPTPTP